MKLERKYFTFRPDNNSTCQMANFYLMGKVGLKMLNLTDYNSISHLFSVSLKTIDQLN